MSDTPILTRFPAGHRLAGKLAWYAEGRFVPYLAGGDGTDGGTATVNADQVTLVDQLRALRKEKVEARAAMVEARAKERAAFEQRSTAFEQRGDAVTDEERTAFDTERTAFDAAEAEFDRRFDAVSEEIRSLKRRIKEQEAMEEVRRAAAKASRGGATHMAQPATYRADNAHEISYFRDLALNDPRIAGAAGQRAGNPAEASERLLKHAKETEEWLPRRRREAEKRAEERVDRAEREFRSSFVRGVRRGGLDTSPFERRVNPNRTDGQGGYFVPPQWLIEEFIPYLRAGRVAAGLCRQMDLPEGTDSINIPKVTTPTLVAPQQADATAVASQTFKDKAVTANVKTLAGQEDIAIQLLEQSPGQIMDRVLMEDLIADYNRLVDRMVIYGSGVGATSLNSGQIAGILPSGNWTANTVTWTSATPLGTSFNQVLGAMASKTSYNRFDMTNFRYLLHPRRWFWFATSLDGATGKSGRPIVNASDGFGPFNVSALEVDPAPAEGLAGRVPFGPPVYIDGNVPVVATSGGAVTGGSNDVGVGAKWDDLWLFEGDLRTRVLPEVLSGTLEVRFQVYNYLAFLIRYGQSVAVAAGTGFAAPTGAIDSSITF